MLWPLLMLLTWVDYFKHERFGKAATTLMDNTQAIISEQIQGYVNIGLLDNDFLESWLKWLKDNSPSGYDKSLIKLGI